jgi:hypothetical protein
MMTTRRRSELTQSTSRPLSAIYLGSGPNPLLPELPEPPSPLVSPSLSTTPRLQQQLPSPPATNSTSGSTGDASSTKADTIGRRGGLVHERVTQIHVDDDDNHDTSNYYNDDNDDTDEENGDGINEDNTAKLSDGLKTTSDQTTGALDRVKNLAERNREVSNKSNLAQLRTIF